MPPVAQDSGKLGIIHPTLQPPAPGQRVCPKEASHSLEHPRTAFLIVPHISCPADLPVSTVAGTRFVACPCPSCIRAGAEPCCPEGSFHSGQLHCSLSSQTKGLGLYPHGSRRVTGVALSFRTVTLAVVRRMVPEEGKAGGWQSANKRTWCVWLEK